MEHLIYISCKNRLRAKFYCLKVILTRANVRWDQSTPATNNVGTEG